MTVFLYILLGIGLIGTLLSLFSGLFSMGRGGAFNQRYGNKLMRMRVYFQLFTVVVFVLLLLHLRG
ncbi:MAG: twin transmembrane helix small protein [Reyranellaceae bacterium]